MWVIGARIVAKRTGVLLRADHGEVVVVTASLLQFCQDRACAGGAVLDR
jgi:hypothetical protein